jgi:hypothetical protein
MMARVSHQLYRLPVKWKLQHIPGTSLPIADFFSRIYKPYECLFSDRKLRYPDLKRENITMPSEWAENPDLILTTADLLEGMRQQIMFIEKSSNNVKEKRLKALMNEVSILYEGLGEQREKLAKDLQNDLAMVQLRVKEGKAAYQYKANLDSLTKASIEPLTANPQRTLITPEYIIKAQNANPKLHNIITMLRTLPREKIPKAIIKRYRLLNDNILITKKKKDKPFEHPGNLRIVCDSKMTIYILSVLHVMSSHWGQNILNHAFSNTYKCVEGSTQGYVKLVCTGCRSCQFIRNTHKKVLAEGRIPLPDSPNSCWMVDHMIFKQGQTFNGRKVVAAFNIMDLFSNLLISVPVKDLTAKTTIECLKRIFAQFNIPRKIVSDNHTALCRSPEVLHFLKSNNIKQVVTVTSHSSQSNKVERLHKIFRETLLLVQETFKRSSQFDMFYTVVRMINSRPLTLSLHPNVKQICKEMGTEPGVVTPFSLHFGLPPVKHPLIPLENTLEPEDRGAFRAKWKHIITEHDKMLQKELDERNKQFKGKIIEVGDLVLIRNFTAHKESVKYYKEIYEVVKIEKARYFCSPLFSKGSLFEANGNRLKPYAYTELFDCLPSKIRLLMGENLSPEQLKEQAENSPGMLPKDLEGVHNWRPQNLITLRNRITPAEKGSEPALSIIETDILSDTTESTSRFSIPDSIPDHRSEVSTLLNNSGISQFKTTKQGMTKTPFKVPLLPKTKPVHIQTPSDKKLQDTAVLIDDWERKVAEKEQNLQIIKEKLQFIKNKMSNSINSEGASIPKASSTQTDNKETTPARAQSWFEGRVEKPRKTISVNKDKLEVRKLNWSKELQDDEEILLTPKVTPTRESGKSTSVKKDKLETRKLNWSREPQDEDEVLLTPKTTRIKNLDKLAKSEPSYKLKAQQQKMNTTFPTTKEQRNRSEHQYEGSDTLDAHELWLKVIKSKTDIANEDLKDLKQKIKDLDNKQSANTQTFSEFPTILTNISREPTKQQDTSKQTANVSNPTPPKDLNVSNMFSTENLDKNYKELADIQQNLNDIVSDHTKQFKTMTPQTAEIDKSIPQQPLDLQTPENIRQARKNLMDFYPTNDLSFTNTSTPQPKETRTEAKQNVERNIDTRATVKPFVEKSASPILKPVPGQPFFRFNDSTLDLDNIKNPSFTSTPISSRDKSNPTPEPQKEASRSKSPGKITGILNKYAGALRDRAKLVKPFKFRDPNFVYGKF